MITGIPARIGNRIKERAWMLFFLAAFWIIVSMLHPMANADYSTSLSTGRNGEDIEAEQGVPLTFTFTCNHENLDGVMFYFDASKCGEHASCRISLMGEDGHEIESMEIRRKDLSGTGATILMFPEIPDSAGKTYTAVIETVKNKKYSGETFTLYGAAASVRGDILTENEQTLGTSLNYQITWRSVTWPKVLRRLLYIIIALSFLIALLIGERADRNFLMLAAFAGIVIITNPIPHPIDEPTHISKAFDIAAGHLVYELRDGSSGIYVPENFHDFMAAYRNKIDLKTIVTEREALSKPFSETQVYEQMEFMNSYPFIAYVPSAAAIALFRMLKAPGYMTLLAARLANYLVYVLLGWIAIRKTKYYRGIVFAVLLLPMVLSIAGSVHSDTLLDVSCVLLIALVLRYRFDQDAGSVTRRDIALMWICTAGIASSKYLIYTPVLLLFFFIPKERFSSRKKWWITLGTALGITLVLGVFQLVLMTIFPYTETRVSGVDVGGQIAYMLQHKRASVELLVTFAVNHLRAYLMPVDMTTWLNGLEAVEFLMPCALYTAAVCAPDKGTFDRPHEAVILRAGIAVFAALICILVVASLYMGFVTVGSTKINGVQPRYFYPIVLPCALALATCFQKMPEQKHYYRNLSFIMLLGAADLLVSAIRSMG